MRWILVLLLVLNALYFVVQQQRTPARVVGEAQVSAGVERHGVRLLADAPSQVVQSAPSADVAPVGRSGDVCMFLGSFAQREQAVALEQRLLSLDVASSIRTFEASGAVDFWVYLSPLASRQASLRQLRELQARRIDSYIITQGELANGISLGIFPRQDSAESVMQRLRTAGYEPRLRELPRSVSSYWVQIAPNSRRLIDEMMLQKLMLDFSGLQHQLMPCSGVASQG